MDNSFLQEDQPARRTPEVNILKEIVKRIIQYWYLFVLSVLICMSAAYIYLRYTIPIYNIELRFLLKKQQGSGGQSDLLEQLNILNNQNDVDNEVEILKTELLTRRTVHEMQLNVSCFSTGIVKSTELYKNAPFTIQILYQNDSLPGISWVVKIDNTKGTLGLDGPTGLLNIHWGDTVKVPGITFVVNKNLSPSMGGDQYLLSISPENSTAMSFLGRLKVAPLSDGVNVVQMIITDPIPERGKNFLNKLYEVYTTSNIEDENSIADNTISFIDNRLGIVFTELSKVEGNIEDFKKANKLIDVVDQGKLVSTNADALQKQLADLEVQMDVLKSVEDRVSDQDGKIVPVTLMLKEGSYASLVERYNSAVLERDQLLAASRINNPVVQQMNLQLDSLRQVLTASLSNLNQVMEINKNDLTQRMNKVEGLIESAPSKERAFLDISREKVVKEQLYLFLLQKREETAILKSGTLSASRLIEPARSEPGPFSPNRQNIYLIGLLVGLIIPAAGIYMAELLNDKIRDKQDIESRTDIPIVGEIGINRSGNALVVEEESRSAIAEQFRAVRTNLQFLLAGKPSKIILITSSMSGEGKSFISANLASSLAISGKKVVLLELDLRKPKLSSTLNLPNDIGFTNYIVSNLDLKYLAKPLPDNPNLYVIGSGPIPPNPAELLLQDKVKTMFEYLSENFDYVVIDSPPIGLVTDALLISKYTDLTLYILRPRYTFRQQLEIVEELAKNRKMNGISILLNQVTASSGRRYGYGYGYGYGYYDYYSGEERRFSLKRLFRKNDRKK